MELIVKRLVGRDDRLVFEIVKAKAGERIDFDHIKAVEGCEEILFKSASADGYVATIEGDKVVVYDGDKKVKDVEVRIFLVMKRL